MKHFLFAAITFLTCAAIFSAEPPANHQRGLRPNRAAYLAAPKFNHQLRMAFATPPESLGFVPGNLTYWGNNQYGSCVSSEAPPAAYAYRLMLNAAGYSIPEFTITDAALIAWARAHNGLNGAMLDDIMEKMGRDGIPDTNKILHLTGKFTAIDYTSQDAIRTAFANFGPLKIAVASSQFDGPVQEKNGWILTGARADRNTDHCVGILGYGRMDYLAKLLAITLPASIDGSKFGVLIFTWATVGICDWSSLQGVMAEGECYARDPVDLPNGKPYPPPGPGPTPTPSTWPSLTGSLWDRGGIIDGTLIMTIPAGQQGGTWKYLIQRNATGQYSPAPQVFGSETGFPAEPPVAPVESTEKELPLPLLPELPLPPAASQSPKTSKSGTPLRFQQAKTTTWWTPQQSI